MKKNKEKKPNFAEFSPEFSYEWALRPLSLQDFEGQSSVKKQLHLFIEAALLRKEPLDHLLLSGPPGLGKTTLSYIIAKEMNAQIKVLSGPLLEKPCHLVGILNQLNENDILFIDEIHRISHCVEEYLYSAMEDFSIDILVDKGALSRSLNIKIPRFTLVGATTRIGLLTAPLRSRFGVLLRLDFYEPKDLQRIILRSASLLNLSIDKNAALEIAKRSRGTARIANRLLRRIRDYAQVYSDGKIDSNIVLEASKMFCVNKYGLDEMDQNFLKILVKKFNGGPVGIKTLSVALNENSETLEHVNEPYLIREGFILRTPNGRKATVLAYDLLNKVNQLNHVVVIDKNGERKK